MKIYELVNSLNKKVTIKTSRVSEVKKYYLSLYRSYMVNLYDKGYISDPTVFNTTEILRNIVDLNINHIFGVNGEVKLNNEDYIGYALCRYKDNEEVLDFLSLLYEAIKYRNISLNIDKFFDHNSFLHESKRKISLKIKQSGSSILEEYKIDEGVLKCFKPYGTNFEFVSLNDTIYNRALLTLGIDDISNNSLFVKGLTRDEEIKYCHLILNGLVNLDGIYANTLIDWLNKTKWSKDKESFYDKGLYDWLIYKKSDAMIKEQSSLLNKLIDEGKTIVCMKPNGFFIIDEVSLIKFPIGLFSVVSDDNVEDQLPEINKLEGYTGEVYSLEFLEKYDLSYVGCPIELYSDSKNKSIYVDKEQTELKDYISWFKHEDARLNFNESLYERGVFPEGSLEDKLYKMVGDSEEGILIGYLDKDDIKNLVSAKKAVGKKL